MTSETATPPPGGAGPVPGGRSPRLRARGLLREALIGSALAVLSLLLFLGAAEGVLRLRGSGEPRRWFVVENTSEGQIVRAVAYPPKPRLPLRLPPVKFTPRKTEGGLRIFCLGDSTMFGYPYGPRGTPPRALEILLRSALPGRAVEVINAGYLGADSSRVLALMRELSSYQPDAFVVYAGHNEFLRFDEAHQYDVHFRFNPSVRQSLSVRAFVAWHESALWRWACGTDLGLSLRGGWQQMRTGQRIGRSGCVRGEMEELVFRSYEANLSEMAALCRSRSVPLVICTVAGNNRSQAPLLRLHSLSTSEIERRESQQALEAAGNAFAEGRAEQALAAARRARELDPLDALAGFLAGRARLAAGDEEGARGDFEEAVRRDGLRHRAFDRISAIARGVASREVGVVLCDVRSEFERRSPFGIIGEELIVDHVHPNLEGMILLARLLERSLAGAGVVPKEAVEGGSPDGEGLIARLGMDRAAFRDSLLRLAMSAAGQVNPERAASLFRIAATLYEPGEADSEVGPTYFRGLAALVEGNNDEARALLREARAKDSGYFERMNDRFAQLRVEDRLR